MAPLAPLALLAAAALAGVSAVPADKARIEEMVTECIVEVLSNALSKPNAPPINPECKEILRKSGRNDRDKNGDKQVEMRHLSEPAENEEHPAGSVEKEQGQAEMESKILMKGSDEKKLGWEEDRSEEEEDGHDISVHEAREDERQTEEMRDHQEAREDENSYYREDRSKEGRHHDEEAERAVPNKKSTGTEEFPDGNDQHSMGWAPAEERTQSPGKRVREGEEGEAERSARSHRESKEHGSSHQREREDSAEREEAAEGKEAHRAERYHRKHRLDDSQEERLHSGEKGKLAEEANVEEGRPWDRRNRHQQHHHEEPERPQEDRRGGSEEEKRDSAWGGEEHGERWQQSSEEQGQRHGQSEEKWQERRPHEGSREAAGQHAEGRTFGEGGKALDRYHEEEQQHRGVERRRLQDSEDEEMQKLSFGESRGQVRRHHSTEESAEQHHDPGNSEEEEDIEEKHQSSHQIRHAEDTEQGRFAGRGQHNGRFPADAERGAAALAGPLRSLLRWKSRRLEKKERVGQQLPESKGEAGPAPADRNLFPEYDYDWWEKKQILDALNHGRAEKRNPGKGGRFDVKRQFSRVDQLAQLLDYRKKAAEFPELYDSGEDIRKRHGIRNDRANLSQRPLTQEEEKELENLAAMDLELQKIAEKLNDNRRG